MRNSWRLAVRAPTACPSGVTLPIVHCLRAGRPVKEEYDKGCRRVVAGALFSPRPARPGAPAACQRRAGKKWFPTLVGQVADLPNARQVADLPTLRSGRTLEKKQRPP